MMKALTTLGLVLILAGPAQLDGFASAGPSPLVSKKKPSVKRSSKKKSRSRVRASGKRGRATARNGRRTPVRSTSTEETNVASSARVTAPGIPSERVIEIQAALRKLGYLEGDQEAGRYDEKTSEAMKNFQKDNKIAATGLPSAHSLKKLGVQKGSNDGYAVSVKAAAEEKKRPDSN